MPTVCSWLDHLIGMWTDAEADAINDALEDFEVVDESRLQGRSIMEILNSGPERRLFQTAEEVKDYLADW